MPPIIKLAELTAEAVGEFSPQLVENGLNLLKLAGDKVARALPKGELSALARKFTDAVPETIAHLPEPASTNTVESKLHLTAVRDLAIDMSDASSSWGGGSKLLEKRFALKQHAFIAKTDDARNALQLFDQDLAQIATANAKRFQSTMTPTFAKLDLPMPRFSSSDVQPGSDATYCNKVITAGRDFFLQPISAQNGSLTAHEVTHLEQAYLIACREADKLGINHGRASENEMDSLMQNIFKTGGMTKKNVESFVAFRAGRQLSSAAAERADKLTDSVVSFFDRPVGQLEVFNQITAIDHFRYLPTSKNINITRSLITRFHNPRKGAEMAQSIFGASEADAERELITSTFPKSELKTWSAEKDAKAKQFLDDAFDRAEATSSRLDAELHDDYWNSLHEREARFNQFIAKEVLDLLTKAR